MASTTTNIGLTKPAGTDQALISAINGNMDIIDTKMGAVGSTSVQSQITSLSDQIATNNFGTKTADQIKSALVTLGGTMNAGETRSIAFISSNASGKIRSDDNYVGYIKKIATNIYHVSVVDGWAFENLIMDYKNSSWTENVIPRNIDSYHQVNSSSLTSYSFDAPRNNSSSYSTGLIYGATGAVDTIMFLYIVFLGTTSGGNPVVIAPVKPHASMTITGSYNASTSKITFTTSETCYGGLNFIWKAN